jgi:branched-chain amino acid transport system substrate-binding protein
VTARRGLPLLTRACAIACAALLVGLGAGTAKSFANDEELVIGVFAPARGENAALGRAVLQGAETAAAKLNARGGVAGRRLRIAPASAGRPWETSTQELTRLLYEEKVWGIVAGTDSRSAHVVEQAVTRARGRVLMVSAWASDPTLAQVPIPWFFRTVPDDRLQAEALVREIFERRQLRHVSVLSDSSLDSRLAASAFTGAAPAGSIIFHWLDRETDDALLAARMDRSASEATVLFLDPSTAAARVRGLRQAGAQLPFFGPLRLAVPEFLERAGSAAEGAVLVAPRRQGSKAFTAFSERYRRLFGGTPSLAALYAHDAVMALVEAVKRAGFERDALSEAMKAVRIPGLTGNLCFTEKGERCEPAGLARIVATNLISMKADLTQEAAERGL